MRRFPAFICILVVITIFCGCEEEDELLTLTISVSGTVTNNSGQSGTIIVEIDYNIRDFADGEGHYSIPLHKDYYIDSLYAYVDLDGNKAFSVGEPYGFFHHEDEPNCAQPIHLRSSSLTNINFTIPWRL